VEKKMFTPKRAGTKPAISACDSNTVITATALNPASDGSFLIADLDGDGCAQDIAYPYRNAQAWSNAWTIKLALSLSTHDLAVDVAGTRFAPGDLMQFVAAVDFDRDDLDDILLRPATSMGWHISYGNPNKAAQKIDDNWTGDAPEFDLNNDQLLVVICEWATGSWLGWTADANAESPR
jgi:hypothetical protein